VRLVGYLKRSRIVFLTASVFFPPAVITSVKGLYPPCASQLHCLEYEIFSTLWRPMGKALLNVWTTPQSTNTYSPSVWFCHWESISGKFSNWTGWLCLSNTHHVSRFLVFPDTCHAAKFWLPLNLLLHCFLHKSHGFIFRKFRLRPATLFALTWTRFFKFPHQNR
jgi:hypothetical protein